MKQKQYPPQTGSYTVKIKSEQTQDRWQDFDTVRLQISVGQDYHEGEKFVSTLEWAAARFDRVIVCVNDTLQRYNLMFEQGLPEEVATIKTDQLGQEWIDRQIPILSNLPHLTLVRWSEWIDRPEYAQTRQQIENLYQNNAEFVQSIHGNIAEMWDRRSKMNPERYQEANRTVFFNLSRAYLLEEITVFSMMYEQETAIDVYPGTVLFAATTFQGRNVPGAPNGLGKGHFARIDFLKKDHRPEMKLAS